MAKVETYSKAWFALMYGKSASTIQRWLHILQQRHVEFAEMRKDEKYLSFIDYKARQKTLTPAQAQIFLSHFGIPDKLQEQKQEKPR